MSNRTTLENECGFLSLPNRPTLLYMPIDADTLKFTLQNIIERNFRKDNICFVAMLRFLIAYRLVLLIFFIIIIII